MNKIKNSKQTISSQQGDKVQSGGRASQAEASQSQGKSSKKSASRSKSAQRGGGAASSLAKKKAPNNATLDQFLKDGGARSQSQKSKKIPADDDVGKHEEDDDDNGVETINQSKNVHQQAHHQSVKNSKKGKKTSQDDDQSDNQQRKKTKTTSKAPAQPSKRKSSAKPLSKEQQIKRELRKKVKQLQESAKEQRRKAAQEIRQKRLEEKQQKDQIRKKRQEQKKEKKQKQNLEKQKRMQAQDEKSRAFEKVKKFIKLHPQYSDESGGVKYPIPDQLLKEHPYLSIRGTKGSLCPRPQCTDLGYIHILAFQSWVNLTDLLNYLELEPFSLQSFHFALAHEEEDDIPLISQIFKALIRKLIEYLQSLTQNTSGDFFDDKDNGLFSLLKNFQNQVDKIKQAQKENNRRGYQDLQSDKSKVLDLYWTEILIWCMESRFFIHFRDENNDEILKNLENMQSPRKFMELTYHFKLVTILFMMRVIMSLPNFRSYLQQSIEERSKIISSKAKKFKEIKQLQISEADLSKEIAEKNVQIKNKEQHLNEQDMIHIDRSGGEEKTGDDQEQSQKIITQSFSLDRQERIRIRRDIDRLGYEVQRLVRRRNDYQKRIANNINSIKSLDIKLNKLKVRNSPLCVDHEKRKYLYFEQDPCRLYVEDSGIVGYYHKSGQFHRLVRSYDECGIKQRKVLEELRRVAGWLDLEDDDGITPMKNQEKFIEKQMAGNANQEEQDEEDQRAIEERKMKARFDRGDDDQQQQNKLDDVKKKFRFKEDGNESNQNSQQEEEKEYKKAKDQKHSKMHGRGDSMKKNDYLIQALSYMQQDQTTTALGKYYTRRSGQNQVDQFQFCTATQFEKIKEFIQQMELKFSQGLNKYLNSKWGGNGARIAWRKQLYNSSTLFDLAFHIRDLESRIQTITPFEENQSKYAKHNTRLWITSFQKSNRMIWINLMTYGAQKRLPALIFGINILNVLMTRYIKREEEKFIQQNPQNLYKSKRRGNADFNQFEYFSRGVGRDNVNHGKSGGHNDNNNGRYKMRNHQATRRAIKTSLQRENKEIQWEDECIVCGQGGEVICCEECSSVAHLECLQLEVSPDVWHCPDCLYSKSMRESSRNKKRNKYVIDDDDDDSDDDEDNAGDADVDENGLDDEEDDN